MPGLKRKGTIHIKWENDKLDISLNGDWNGRMLKRVYPAIMREYKRSILSATRAERVKTAVPKKEVEKNVRVESTGGKSGGNGTGTK